MTGPGGANNPADLDIDPAAAREWLDNFARVIRDIEKRNDRVQELAREARGTQLGDIPFSVDLQNKMADRFGDTGGGLARAVGEVIVELENLHEAMRQSLAAQLGADLAAERILNRTGDQDDG